MREVIWTSIQLGLNFLNYHALYPIRKNITVWTHKGAENLIFFIFFD